MSGSTASGQTTYTWFPPSFVSADILVVAGGGTGGHNKEGTFENGGGGGGGGVVYNSSTLTPESQTIIVGQGGIIPTGNGQSKGRDSSGFGLTALGGGGGSTRNDQTNINGGSGGGAVNFNPNTKNGQATQPTSVSGGLGNDGGIAQAISSDDGGSAGGGGAGGVGNDGSSTTGGNGGSGTYQSNFSNYGVNGYFAGGGGGGGGTAGSGGSGGGGNAGSSTSINGASGIAHTGGGGGGNYAPSGSAGNGGSGIVILKYTFTNDPTEIPFLYGGTDDGLRFPTAVMDTSSNYTLFHVARYYNPTGAPTRGRIFNGATLNWLSGFHGDKSGVAYHGDPPNGGWVTPQTNLHGSQWVLSTDQRNMYRSNGTNRTSSGYSNGASDQLGINIRFEYSDWACAEVIVYSRELTSAEYLSVEEYLSAKYFDKLVVLPATGVISGSLLQALFYRRIDGGYPLSIPRFGQRLGVTLGTILKASHFRGVGLGGALDTIPLPLPSAVYSLRRLFNDYGGPQVRVRRSSDDLEADILMDKDGVIVTIENSTEKNLTTWLGGATAHVTTWYDQSGNGNNIIQATSTSQPTLNVIDGEASYIRFQDKIMTGPNVFGGSSVTDMHLVFASRENVRSSNFLISLDGTNTDARRFTLHSPWVNATWYWDPGQGTTNRAESGGGVTEVGEKIVFSGYKSSIDGNNGFRLNVGTRFLSPGTSSGNVTDGIRIGTDTADHSIYELFIFPSKLEAATELAIETNVSDYI